MKRWMRILPLLCLSALLCATLAAADMAPTPLNCHEMAALWFTNQDDAQLLGADGAEAALSEYFTAREAAFRGDTRLLSADEDMGASVAESAALRTERVREMESRLGLAVLDADVTTRVERDRTVRNPDGTLTLYVYEWTFYDYDDLSDGAGGLDVSGFGTWHILTVAERPDGSYEILSDEYDESDILGISTLSEERRQELLGRASAEPDVPYTAQPADAASLLAISYYSDYNVQAAVDYSETYWQNYNPKYANFNNDGGDCANFTSQSIYADGKGMPQVVTKHGSLDGWYYKSANDRSATWASSTSLRQWMANNRGHLVNLRKNSTNISGAKDAVFTGSPVFYSTKGDGSFQHAVLCVGENSAGTPVINSHNSDRYHAVWTYYTGSKDIDTVQLTSEKFGSFSGYVKMPDNDFYANIINPSLSRYVTNDGEGKVSSRAETKEAGQVWRFTLQDDGSYLIESALKDGSQKTPALAVAGGAWDSRTPICTEDDAASPGQRWYLYWNAENAQAGKGAYLLRPQCSDRVMDIVEGNAADGAGLWLFSRNGTDAQFFTIYETSWVELDTPVLKVKPEGSEGANVTFSWESIDGAASYNLRITPNGGETSSITVRRNVSYATKLKPGDYQAALEAVSANGRTKSLSDPVSFNVPTSYTITFNPNGGEGGPTEQMKIQQVDAILTEEIPVRAGYNFVSWNTQASGSGQDYAPGATYDKDEDLSLYARWAPCEYVVTLDPNGGSLAEQEREYAVTYKMPYGGETSDGEPRKMPTPELKDNEFMGWYTELTEGELVTEETIVNTPENHTLYAHWESSVPKIYPSVAKAGSQHIVSATLYRIPSGVLFACGYLNGQFVAAASKDVGETQDMTLNGDFDSILIMALDDTDNMRPLCESKSVLKNAFIGN